MYIDIGGDLAVRDRTIVGIFDLDGTTVSRKTVEYLEKTQENGLLIIATEDLPKSFLVTEEYGMERVYVTQFNAATLEKRAEG